MSRAVPGGGQLASLAEAAHVLANEAAQTHTRRPEPMRAAAHLEVAGSELDNGQVRAAYEELRTARRSLLAYAEAARDFRLTGLTKGRVPGSPAAIAQAKDLANRGDALFCAARDITLAARVNGRGGH